VIALAKKRSKRPQQHQAGQTTKPKSSDTTKVTTLDSQSERFALLNKLIMRDLNNNRSAPTFSRYSKDDITRYLANPYRYEKQLRDAVIYIYGASSHFRRLIQYFVGLSDLAYIVEPYKIDPKKANIRITNNNYRKVLNALDSMSIKTQFPSILTVCLREDTWFGTMWVTNDDITFQQLPSDYCAISSKEGHCLNVTFNFSYFDAHAELLDYYPQEFKTKYEQYKKNRANRWIELDSPTSFAIKCNDDILNYSIPPFAGLLREIYDLEDYRNLKLTKTALENYAMIVTKIPLNDDGTWGIDLEKAVEFWQNLSSVLPEEIGSVLTPMDMEKISFERTHAGDTQTVTDAEQNMFSAAGVSSQLFNNPKASANSLLLSIKADQMITYGVVKGIEDAVNRFIQAQPYGKNFHINFLDCSPYNRKEMGDAYLKAASYGFPTISAYCASQGIGQSQLDNMSFLEGEVLGLAEMFKPVQSSSQMSSSDLEGEGATDEGGAPTKEVGEVSDSREQNREQE
jgi:hypothetical protein